MPTRDQERARLAYACAEARANVWATAENIPERKENISKRKEYRNMARSASALIRASGLAQALEFIDTRSEAQSAVLEDLGRVVLRQYENHNAKIDLKRQSREYTLTNYMLLTRESLACLQWLARFGQSVMEVD